MFTNDNGGPYPCDRCIHANLHHGPGNLRSGRKHRRILRGLSSPVQRRTSSILWNLLVGRTILRTPTRTRKGISPVLATVILIAITLIAAIAVAGFVFGLFGSFTSTARVTVSYSVMVHLAAGGVAASGSSILVLNTGTSNTYATGLTLTYGGQTCTEAVAATTITAGASPGVNLAVTPPASGGCTTVATVGQSYVGSLSLANGGQVPFSGTWS